MKALVISFLTIFLGFALGLLAFHPVAQALERFATTACNATTPCIGGSNASTGQGVIGESSKGNGIAGYTKNVAGTLAAGVFGEDQSTAKASHENVGVYGKALLGTAGVEGVSSKGFGVLGTSTYGNGVEGHSTAGGTVAVHGDGPTGVEGDSTAGGLGVLATTTGTHSYGSPALQAEASNGAPVAAFYGFDQSVVIDTGANIHTTGEIYTAGTCTSGCIRRNIESYATTAAVPTIEDYGEAQTSAGITYVRLDRVFANVIDPQQGYLVFVTPEGDTRGLYVTQRTATGFAVREIGGGHGKVPFAYRIVAHPLGKRLPRLPVNELPALHSASR